MGILVNMASSVVTGGTIPPAMIDGVLISATVLQGGAGQRMREFLDSVTSRLTMLDSGGWGMFQEVFVKTPGRD
jgi:H+/gluconate symporter-like permease